MTDLHECLICCQTEDRVYREITSKCTDKAVVCVECVNKCIESSISDEKLLIEISCPTGCGEIMERHDIKNIATEETFEKYDSLAFKFAIHNIPEYIWCKVPCGAGQIHIGKDALPVVICEGCGAKSCYTHQVIWHMGLTCKEYSESKKNSDFATEDYLSQKAKGCPGCSIFIEKDGGCNHITCSKCSYEFCWLCLNKHPSHKSTCEMLKRKNGNNLLQTFRTIFSSNRTI